MSKARLIITADATSDETVELTLQLRQRARATAQARAAWLNLAHGAVGWTAHVTPDLTFAELVAEIETILLDPAATKQALEHTKDLAETVNMRDQEYDC